MSTGPLENVGVCVFKSRSALGYKEYRSLNNSLYGLFLHLLFQCTSTILWICLYQQQNTDKSYKNSALIVFIILTNKSNQWGTSLVVQWLRLHTSNAGDPGSIPGRGTKITYTTTKAFALQWRPSAAKINKWIINFFKKTTNEMLIT